MVVKELTFDKFCSLVEFAKNNVFENNVTYYDPSRGWILVDGEAERYNEDVEQDS